MVARSCTQSLERARSASRRRWGEAHTDGDGHLVPSRAPARDEFVALAGALRDHDGTTLEFIPCVGEIRADRMAAHGRHGGGRGPRR